MKFCLSIILMMAIVYLALQFMAVTDLFVEKSTNYLYPDGTSTITINVLPMNRFGVRVPFRNVIMRFDIIEGEDKIQVINKELSRLTLRARYETGDVIIRIENQYTVLPIRIEIHIIKPTA
jgi:hypothetical protein